MYQGYFDVVVEAIILPTAGARTARSRPLERRLLPVAAKPVTPPRSTGAAPAGRRRPSQIFVRDDVVRLSSATVVSTSPVGAAGRDAIGLAAPSSAFLAQYLAQRSDLEPQLDGLEAQAARFAYQAAAGRDIAYFGFDAPVDVTV